MEVGALIPCKMQKKNNGVDNSSFDVFLRDMEPPNSESDTDESISSFDFTASLEPTPIRTQDNIREKNTVLGSIQSHIDPSRMTTHQFLNGDSQELGGNLVIGPGNTQMTLSDKPLLSMNRDISSSSSINIAGQNSYQGVVVSNDTVINPNQTQNYIPQQPLSQNTTDLEAYSIAMEKLCQTMKRSAMSRTLVKQLSGRSLVKQSSGRNLVKQSSGRNLGVLARQASGRSLNCDSNSSGNVSGRLTPPTVPLRKPFKDPKHRSPKAAGRGILRQNSNKSVHNSQRSSIQIDDTNFGFLLAGDDCDSLSE